MLLRSLTVQEKPTVDDTTGFSNRRIGFEPFNFPSTKILCEDSPYERSEKYTSLRSMLIKRDYYRSSITILDWSYDFFDSE